MIMELALSSLLDVPFLRTRPRMLSTSGQSRSLCGVVRRNEPVGVGRIDWWRNGTVKG